MGCDGMIARMCAHARVRDCVRVHLDGIRVYTTGSVGGCPGFSPFSFPPPLPLPPTLLWFLPSTPQRFLPKYFPAYYII
jgi:hypothetical protein